MHFYHSEYTIRNSDAEDRSAVVKFIRRGPGLIVVGALIELKDDEAETITIRLPLTGKYKTIRSRIATVAERIYIHLMQHDPIWDEKSLDYDFNDDNTEDIRVRLSTWAMTGLRAMGQIHKQIRKG
jgi:hypothetical protein